MCSTSPPWLGISVMLADSSTSPCSLCPSIILFPGFLSLSWDHKLFLSLICLVFSRYHDPIRTLTGLPHFPNHIDPIDNRYIHLQSFHTAIVGFVGSAFLLYKYPNKTYKMSSCSEFIQVQFKAFYLLPNTSQMIIMFPLLATQRSRRH